MPPPTTAVAPIPVSRAISAPVKARPPLLDVVTGPEVPVSPLAPEELDAGELTTPPLEPPLAPLVVPPFDPLVVPPFDPLVVPPEVPPFEPEVPPFEPEDEPEGGGCGA